MTGIHIQWVMVSGVMIGFLYDVEYNVYNERDENSLIICFLVFGIKINWW